MTPIRDAIWTELVAAGIPAATADDSIVVFARFYTVIAEHNRHAEATGQPAHPESHPEREALALVLTAELSTST